MQAYEHNVSVYAELFRVRLHSHFLLFTYENTLNTVGKGLSMRCFVAGLHERVVAAAPPVLIPGGVTASEVIIRVMFRLKA